MVFALVQAEIDKLLADYLKSEFYLSHTYSDHIISKELLLLQEAYTRLSHDRTFMSELSRFPNKLEPLGIKRCIHLNRLIVRILVDPILRSFSQNGDIDNFSRWDVYLFSHHIQLLDNPAWFAEAFWDINRHSFGLLSRSKLLESFSILKHTSSKYDNGPIIFVFKGVPCFAHFQNLVGFLESIKNFGLHDRFRVVFLDSGPEKTPPISCKAFYLNDLSVSDKIRTLHNLVANTNCSLLVWVAAVQNLGLYLFSRLAPVQAYWSMKYHSIVCSQIDINFRSSTYADQISVDNATWHGVPFDFTQIANDFLSKCHKDVSALSSKVKFKQGDSRPSIRLLTLGREIKINNSSFSNLIGNIINLNKFTYSYSGRSPAYWHKEISSQLSSPEILNFSGWLNKNQIFKALLNADIYIDSFPFGGGHTCFYAMAMSVPILMVNTEQNRRCSYMMHLLDLRTFFGKENNSLESIGVFEKSSHLGKFLENLTHISLLDATKLITSIAEKQSSLFNQWGAGRHVDDQYKLVATKMFSIKKSIIKPF